MKALVLLSILTLSLLIACSKNKYTTSPQFDLKSISPDNASLGNIIRLKGKFTDKEGDVDSAYIVYKWYEGTNAVRHDTFRYYVPALGVPTATKDGDITIEFAYGQFINGYTTLPNTPVVKDTSCALGLILVDHQKNKSDYKESAKIRLKKP